MSTLVWELAGAVAPATDTEVGPTLWGRLIETRQAGKLPPLTAGEGPVS